MERGFMTIYIETEYITLSQFLKLADLIMSGGEDKMYLGTHKILVNGIEDNRRGRKLYDGDEVNVQGKKYQIRHK